MEKEFNTLVGYWNGSYTEPVIRFDIPSEEEIADFKLVQLEIKELQTTLKINPVLKDEVKKLDKGLKKLINSMDRIKYGK